MRDMDDDRIDFSPLDPAADPARWERLVGSLTARALAARRRPRTVAAQLAVWARPVLAAAAVVAVGVWVASMFAPGARQPLQETAEAGAVGDPAPALLEWASRGEPPSTAELFETLGGGHVGTSR